MSVNCVYCGHVNPDGSTVCLSCGRTLPPAPSPAPGSYGQQQPPQQPPSWGSAPPAQPPPPSYPPPTNPYGGSYPPQDPGYGTQPPPAAPQPPSYGSQPGYGGASYPPQPSSFGQPPAPVWGAEQQSFGQNDAAKSAKQLALIGMICGIVGAVLGWCCYSGFLFGPAAIILGFLGKSKLANANSTDGNTMALVAIGLGILAFIEPIIYIIIIFVIFGGLSMISH